MPTVLTLDRKNPLLKLNALGQSIWLDYIRRSLIESGELRRLVEEDGVTGVTSNPAIFEKAITASGDYAQALARLQAQGLEAARIYERLAVQDIQAAADVLRPVYDRTARRDGYVSLEVSPFLAHDREATLAEARRLWRAVGRDNLMIKVPATEEGAGAVEELISDGLNVNVTLLFSRKTYERVAWAYVAGLERALTRGKDIRRIASVASFFVSRIDTAVDAMLARRLESASDPADRALIESLMGKAAVANAKLAHVLYKEVLRSERWTVLEARGARTQRLLWASTGVKNPSYGDVMYAESLIGPDTIDTMPPATLDAFRDHGKPRRTLDEDLGMAVEVLRNLELLGISLEEVSAKALRDGVRLFAEPFDKILDAVDPKRRTPPPAGVGRQSWTLPPKLGKAVDAALADWRARDKARRLWARDPSLWTRGDEDDWMGWLDIVEAQSERIEELYSLQEKVRQEGVTHALLLGMGGSSLAAEVFKKTLGAAPGYPELVILDSTDPAQVRAAEKSVDLARAVFIVSSKSGGTLEPTLFAQYFLDRAKAALGEERARRRFLAVTDPGSKLEDFARREGFRRVFHGVRSIGGRYSALSDFGLVPAAVMGADLGKLLDRAYRMVVATSSCVAPEENPAVRLGLLLGTAAKQGRDKVTMIASPALASFGAWTEQLLGESTGKDGRGLVPVDREPLGPPEAYGDDRLFVYLRLEAAPDSEQDAAVARLAQAGHPVARIDVVDVLDLGQEFFRWELATAAASSVLRVHPFNQPDVEASKVATHRLTDQFEASGELPPEAPFLAQDGMKLFADAATARRLLKAAAKPLTISSILRAHLDTLRAGDYFALLAYLEMKWEHEEELSALRLMVRDAKRVATCAGFGPRFLHSTGQVYKGGPASGVFLQLTCDDARDVSVPGRKATFGVVKAAQARGDLEVLGQRGRRALRVHLGAEPMEGLRKLHRAMRQALPR